MPSQQSRVSHRYLDQRPCAGLPPSTSEPWAICQSQATRHDGTALYPARAGSRRGRPLLSGRAGMHRSVDAVVAQNEPSAPSAKEAERVAATRPDVKTMRPPASDVSEAESAPTPVRVASAIPSPRDIFDFHPAGSASSSFRQPFIIDPNDGPLTADVRRTAAELKAFNEQMKTGTAVAARQACRETVVAAKTPGCVKPATRAAAVTSDTAVQ